MPSHGLPDLICPINIDHGTNFFYVDRIHWVFIAQNVQYFDRSTRALWMDNGQF